MPIFFLFWFKYEDVRKILKLLIANSLDLSIQKTKICIRINASHEYVYTLCIFKLKLLCHIYYQLLLTYHLPMWLQRHRPKIFLIVLLSRNWHCSNISLQRMSCYLISLLLVALPGFWKETLLTPTHCGIVYPGYLRTTFLNSSNYRFSRSTLSPICAFKQKCLVFQQ